MFEKKREFELLDSDDDSVELGDWEIAEALGLDISSGRLEESLHSARNDFKQEMTPVGKGVCSNFDGWLFFFDFRLVVSKGCGRAVVSSPVQSSNECGSLSHCARFVCLCRAID